jgi:hypothetical protein
MYNHRVTSYSTANKAKKKIDVLLPSFSFTAPLFDRKSFKLNNRHIILQVVEVCIDF